MFFCFYFKGLLLHYYCIPISLLRAIRNFRQCIPDLRKSFRVSGTKGVFSENFFLRKSIFIQKNMKLMGFMFIGPDFVFYLKIPALLNQSYAGIWHPL